jgi:hypothetical protein
MLQAVAISPRDSGVILKMSRIDSTTLIIGLSLPNYSSLPSFMGFFIADVLGEYVHEPGATTVD